MYSGGIHIISTKGALRLPIWPMITIHPILPIYSSEWAKQAQDDLSRPPMTSNDYLWLIMTINKFQWLPMTTNDYILAIFWLFLTTFWLYSFGLCISDPPACENKLWKAYMRVGRRCPEKDTTGQELLMFAFSARPCWHWWCLLTIKNKSTVLA